MRNQHSVFAAYVQATKNQKTGSRPDITIIKEGVPRIDKMLKPVTDAVWDAWLIGLEQSGYNVRNEPAKDSMEMEM